MAVEGGGGDLLPVVMLLGAAVVAVPVVRPRRHPDSLRLVPK